MLRMLVDRITEHAIIMLDPEGNMVSWSPAAERLKGYSAAEVVGKHFSIFATPEDASNGKTDVEILLFLSVSCVEGLGLDCDCACSQILNLQTGSEVQIATGGFAYQHKAPLKRLMTSRGVLSRESRIFSSARRGARLLSANFPNLPGPKLKEATSHQENLSENWICREVVFVNVI
jgi:hypothetical protein